MFNAALLFYDVENPAPTAKDIKDYLRNSSKLLYGNDQRKSKSFILLSKIHNVPITFGTFKNFIINEGSKNRFFYELYVFDEKANSTHFALKYGNYSPLFFKLDISILDKMHVIEWNYNRLVDARDGIKNTIHFQKWAVENNIGSRKLHKSFPTFAKAAEAQMKKFDIAILEEANKAVALFKSGW